MPIGVMLFITVAIMAMRRGIDFPLACVASSLGDHSNGTILQKPVDMVGELLGEIWKLAIAAFERTGDTTGAIHHVVHLAGLAV